MNAEPRGGDAADPGDEAIRASFAAYREDAANAFPPPPVDDLLMSGPAKLRRRRLISLAAVAGAATAVTAGGFAVAQTVGPLSNKPDPAPPSTSVETPQTSELDPGTRLGEPATPETNESDPSTEETEQSDNPSELLLLEEWTGVCDGGELAFDPDAGEFTVDTEWAVPQMLEADLDGDGTDELVLALSCGERTAVAAFGEAEVGLEQWGWVWQPDESQQLSEISGAAEGVITLQGLDDASGTWTARYEWDGGAFVEIDDSASGDPSPSESSATPAPDETQATSPPASGGDSGS